jgi:hypothetical protein
VAWQQHQHHRAEEERASSLKALCSKCTNSSSSSSDTFQQLPPPCSSSSSRRPTWSSSNSPFQPMSIPQLLYSSSNSNLNQLIDSPPPCKPSHAHAAGTPIAMYKSRHVNVYSTLDVHQCLYEHVPIHDVLIAILPLLVLAAW